MTDPSMTITAEQATLLAMHNLVLHQFVGYEEFVLPDLFRKVKMTDDALLRVFLGDVEDEP